MAAPPELSGAPHCRRWGRDACSSTAPAPRPTKVSPGCSGSPSYRGDVPSPSPRPWGASAPSGWNFLKTSIFWSLAREQGGLPGCLEESPPTPARAEGIGSGSFSPPGVPGPPQLPRPGLCLSLSLCRDGRSGRLCCAPDFRALRKITTLTRFCSFNLVSVALLSAFVKFCILILFVVVSSFLFLFFFFWI